MDTAPALEVYRKRLGLTQAQTAVALGLSASSSSWISEIESGRRQASIRLALKIERWSAGEVPASSVCDELREDHDPSPSEEAPTLAPVSAEVSGAKAGAVQ
jgi:transcriptional regulator with XRE-family HTH domain